MDVLCLADPGIFWLLLPNDAEEGVADLVFIAARLSCGLLIYLKK